MTFRENTSQKWRSCMTYLGFQPTMTNGWACPSHTSWYDDALWQKGASWHFKQHCQLEFSTCSYKKMIFHFSSAKYSFFCEAATKSKMRNGTMTIFTESTSFGMDKSRISGFFSVPSYFSTFKRISAEFPKLIQICTIAMT